MLKLSPKWAPKLVAERETGMGYWMVTVTLQDGRTFDRVTLDSGYITAVNGATEIPFTEDQIADIRVTHERPRPGDRTE